MNPKSIGNLLALTTSIGLASSAMAQLPVTNLPTIDEKDAYCLSGIIDNPVDTSVCDTETMSRLVAMIQANIANGATPEEIRQWGGGQKQQHIEDEMQ